MPLQRTRKGGRSEVPYSVIDDRHLASKLEKYSPGNESRDEGFALVSVSHCEVFLRERIPGSMHIPHDDLSEFASRFERTKEIIVYSISRQCEALPSVVRALAAEGFERVLAFEGGLEEWRDAGHPLVGTAHP